MKTDKILLVLCPYRGHVLLFFLHLQNNAPGASLTPWQCIGGCAQAGRGIRRRGQMVGTGVSGGLIDAEVMGPTPSENNFRYQQIKTRLSWKRPDHHLGLTIPIVAKIGTLSRRRTLMINGNDRRPVRHDGRRIEKFRYGGRILPIA